MWEQIAFSREGSNCLFRFAFNATEPAVRLPSCSLRSRTIGIGGHLTMPPLPHHRAYGSVPRRFGGLSARQRLHGKQSKTFEALVGEGPMQCARRTQSPWSLRTQGHSILITWNSAIIENTQDN